MIGRRLVAGTAVVAAVAAGGVAGALIGVPGFSGAATSSTTTEKSHGHFGPFGAGKDVLGAAAKALDLSTEDLLTKLSDGKTTIADIAKQQNVDVQTVIDAMAAVAKADITDFVNNPLPEPKFEGGRHGRGFGFGHRGVMRENKLGAAAKALGITTDELLKDLRDGQSIADVAKAKNVDVNTIIDAMVGDAQTAIDAAVKAGDLTQDQATELKSTLKDHITALVNNTRPKGDGPFEQHLRGGNESGRWDLEAPAADAA